MPWPIASRLLFRRGGLFAAASLSSAETEEREPTGVFDDEAGCMGLIFWLSDVLIQTGILPSRLGERGKVLAGGKNS